MKNSSSHQSFLTRFKYRAKPIRKYSDLLTPGDAPINKKMNITKSHSFDKSAAQALLGLNQLAPIALVDIERSFSYNKTPQPAYIKHTHLTPISLPDKNKQASFGTKSGNFVNKSSEKMKRKRLQLNASMSLVNKKNIDGIRSYTNIKTTKSSLGNPIGDFQHPVDFSKMRSNQIFDYSDNSSQLALQAQYMGDVTRTTSQAHLPPILNSSTPVHKSAHQLRKPTKEAYDTFENRRTSVKTYLTNQTCLQ